MTMFLLAAAILTAGPAPTRVSATVQATATIRVERGVRVKLDGSPNPGASAARETLVKLADGTSQTVKIIEFQ